MRLHKREQHDNHSKIEWLTSNEVLSDPDHIQAVRDDWRRKYSENTFSVWWLSLHELLMVSFYMVLRYSFIAVN